MKILKDLVVYLVELCFQSLTVSYLVNWFVNCTTIPSKLPRVYCRGRQLF